MRNDDWTAEENRLIVGLAFAMRDAISRGDRVNKKFMRREVQKQLNGRTDKPREYKLGNVISALVELGLERVPGYAPYGNKQKALVDEVRRQAESRGDLPRQN